MGQVINTNSLSLLTQNNLNKSQGALNTAIQRLSSGMRINSAKDDAAGQAIANRFTANIKGLTQASRNANDGISLAQTTEGALGEVNTNLQRIRELAVQSANGSNSDADKSSIQAEITQRLQEIDRTSQQTDFNGVKVLSSSAGKLTVQVGANDGEKIDIDLQEISAKTLGLTGFNVDGTGTKNTAASATDLAVSGFGKSGGVSANGTQTYTRSYGAADAAKGSDVFAGIANGGKVVATAASITYTKSTANSNFSFDETGRSNANSIASLKPAAGGSITATVTIGSKSQDVKIDSAGAITDANDGSLLYLDATKNLTKTGSASTLATLADLTDAAKGMQVADTIRIGGATGTLYTAAASNAFNVTNDKITDAALQSKVNGLAYTVDQDGSSASTADNYSVAVTTGAVTMTTGGATANIDLNGKLTANTAETLFANSNGSVTNAFAETIYANAGKLTTKAVSNATATADPLKALDAALSKVDKLRGALGAVQNRFDSVISNLGTTITNLTSSRSRIEDADYATEVSNMTRANILQQAGTSVLAQANQSTQGVLSLLR
ncbi:flagellin [Polaromonas sp.]|uniref:flagellin N-terminal helical domain-containing protein n=1 Tax=Polaromonas sp. TaxID=1869339 RepID=UPI0017DF5678|nr:flagellin [Polaromonas sp.]NMM05799.1 flagellin FliC [Polaromonas sp.]